MSGLFSNFKAATAADISQELNTPAVRALYAAVGLPHGSKIPISTVDAALAKMPDMNLQKRMAFKSEMARLQIIEL